MDCGMAQVVECLPSEHEGPEFNSQSITPTIITTTTNKTSHLGGRDGENHS
jgi:hypothetical protein